MRKSLLLFLVALIMPALAFAVDNKAISKTKGTYSNTEYATDENIVYVDYNALGWEQAATPDEGANFSIGMWFKTTSIFNNDIKKAVLMRLGTADPIL